MVVSEQSGEERQNKMNKLLVDDRCIFTGNKVAYQKQDLRFDKISIDNVAPGGVGGHDTGIGTRPMAA